MPDEADELILKMQHLEAQARESERARAGEAGSSQLKSAAQKMAHEAQAEVDAAQKAQSEGEAKVARAQIPGAPTLEAADLLIAGRQEAQDARTRLVQARARLNFAEGRMDDAERGEWDALQASARAETHGQLADDPLFKGPAGGGT